MMRTVGRILAVLPLVMGLSAATSPAHASAGIAWQKSWQSVVSNPLDTFEQPSPTYNPTSCAWNDQDRIEDRGTGTLDVEITDTQCVIADLDDSWHGNMPKNFAAEISGAKPDFTAWITSDVGGYWALSTPAYDATLRSYVTRGCIADPIADAANSPVPLESYWPQVPGSAGYGKQINYTLHVAPTARPVLKFWVLYEVHGSAYTPFDPGWSPRYLNDVLCPANDGV